VQRNRKLEIHYISIYTKRSTENVLIKEALRTHNDSVRDNLRRGNVIYKFVRIRRSEISKKECLRTIITMSI